MDRYVTDIKNGCYQNPVLPMDFSDPDAIRVGEDYYQISSSFTYLPGVPVLHSKDLVHWERIGNCVERLPFDRYAQPAHGCGTWAPALRYHVGRFYAFIPLPDEGIFYTEATDPAGPWSALHCVKSASGWIDPCPLWDDDGSVYMAHAFAKSRCGIKHKIQLSRLDPETLEVVEDGPIVFDDTLSQPTAAAPAIVPGPATEPTPRSAEASPPEDDHTEAPLRVLVVDDHAINRRAIQLILQSVDCEIAMAEDGLAALEACERAQFDVVFMDVRMPELDGRETTRRLRAGGGLNAAVPVIAVTADTAPDDIAACTAAGMNYFVSKPLTPGSLLGALSQVLTEAAEAADAAESAAA